MGTPRPPSSEVKAKVLQLFEGDDIPDCVIEIITRRCMVDSNGKLLYAPPTAEEAYPISELINLQDSLAVRPYLKGYLLRDAGLEAMLLNTVTPSPLHREAAVKCFALGFAECPRVMGVQTNSLVALSATTWWAEHPDEPLGLLLQAHVCGAPSRGDAWLAQRLEQLAPLMPSPLLRAKVLAAAADLHYETGGDMHGALRMAVFALQQMPQHMDMLFLKANCLHRRSGMMPTEDGSNGGPTEQDIQRLLQQSSVSSIYSRAAAAHKAYEEYFSVAAPEHPHKPAAHFSFALLQHSFADLQYPVRCRGAGVTQQAAAAALNVPAQDVAEAASDPEIWKALLVLRQVLDKVNPCVEAHYRAGLSAETAVPGWLRATHKPAAADPEYVKETLEHRQRTLASITAVAMGCGVGAPSPPAAGSSSRHGAAAAGAEQVASSSSSSSNRSSTATAGVGGVSSSAVPPATDDQLRPALLQLVAASDMTVVPYKHLHQQLEAQFQMDLSHKMSFLKEVLREVVPTNSQALQPAAEAAPKQQQRQQQQQQQQPGSSAGSSSSSAARASSPTAAAAAPGSAAKSSRCCQVCKARPPELMRCSRCKAVRYCSTACQTQDWHAHKAVCVKKPPAGSSKAPSKS